MNDTKFDKWGWMMDYCYKMGIPAAQAWAWSRADAAYNNYIGSIKK